MTTAEHMNIAVVGHVDHGKSTVVGRLLADTGSLPHGKIESVRDHCKTHSKDFEYAFLIDALKSEQQQGVTIDCARVFFKSEKRNYMILDAPGHMEFLKNMITGASQAEAALLIIDAQEGVKENSKRHGYMLSLLGVKQVVVLVNKMDLIHHDQNQFLAIVEEYRMYLRAIGVEPKQFIPVSGRGGDNIFHPSQNIAWYHGPTTIEALDSFTKVGPITEGPFRLSVQGVYKFTDSGDQRRIIAGTVESGGAAVGDEIQFHPSGKKSRIKSFEIFNSPPLMKVQAGQAIGFTLEEPLYLQRGEVASLTHESPPLMSRELLVSLFWLDQTPLKEQQEVILRLGTEKVMAQVVAIEQVIDANSLGLHPTKEVGRNGVAQCRLRLKREIALETHSTHAHLGRFVLVQDYEIVGGGIVREVNQALSSSSSLDVGGFTLWLTGLSGSGKTTITNALVKSLNLKNLEVLDGDVIRDNLSKELGFSKEDRDTNVHRLGFICELLNRHGVNVIVSAISPYEEARSKVRSRLDRFVEVFVNAPLAVCEERDVKGLYGRARRGEIKSFTGIDDPYEAPQNPDVELKTDQLTVKECVELVRRYLNDRDLI